MRSFVPEALEPGLEPYRQLAAAYSRGGTVDSVRTVAVVGNAPLEESPERARAIDDCDLVFRVNGFALDGPGRPVTCGTRADVAVISGNTWPTPWTFADHSRRLYFIPNGWTTHQPHVAGISVSVLSQPNWPPDLGQVYVPNREVALPFSEEIGMPAGTWPTSGTTAIGLAVALFPSATTVVTGYSFIDDPHQKAWKHAWDHETTAPMELGPPHDVVREGALLRRWLSSGRLTALV